MAAYYNEIDPLCAQWLRNLIARGLIAPGDVDERDIRLVRPEDLRGYRQHHFFAGISGWSYALRLAGWPDDREVWTGSCPCFPAGTLVMTRRGYLPIEDVVVGDFVLTHRCRWKRVTHVGSEFADTVTVKGQGHWGIACTPNHPFLTGDDQWSAAVELKGKRWATVSRVPETPIPPVCFRKAGYFFDKSVGRYRVKGEKDGKSVYIAACKTEHDASQARTKAIRECRIDVRGADAVDVSSVEFAYFLGYWVGDGWVSGDSVLICGSRGDDGLLKQIMTDAGLPCTLSHERTGPRARVGSKALKEWLLENFGSGASRKRLPVWLHGARTAYRKAFLAGYARADGHTESTSTNSSLIRRFTTVSRALAVGVRVLLNQDGVSASIEKHTINRTNIIEGRRVNERPFYRVTAYERARSFRFCNRYGWGVVRSVQESGTSKVYNLSVEEDESYTADGLVVHNCQPLSVAGPRTGHLDKRHLWPAFYGLISECKPAVVFGEQTSGKDGREWLAGVRMDLEDAGYACGAANIGSVCVGAPNIRLRLYWCAYRLADPGGPRTRRDARASDGAEAASSRERCADRHQRDTSEPCGAIGRLGHASGEQAWHPRFPWRQSDTVACADGNVRRIEPGSFPLVARLPKSVGRGSAYRDAIAALPRADQGNRQGRIRGYGNAINPVLAAEFIEACEEARQLTSLQRTY